MKQYSVNAQRYEEDRIEYVTDLHEMNEAELIREFISYLDYVEESDSGNVFHPITIGCSRVMATKALSDLLKEMRSRV